MATQLGAGRLIGHRVLDNQGNSAGKIGEVYYDDQSDVAKWVTVRTGLFGTRESFVPLKGASQVDDDIQVPYDRQTIKDAPHFDVGQRISADEERQIFQHYDKARSGVPGQRESSEEMRADEAGGRHAASGAETADAETGTSGAAPETGAAADTAGTETGMTAGTGSAETGTDTEAEAAGTRTGTADAQTAPSAEAEMSSGTEEATMTRFEERIHVGTERAEAGRVHLRKHVDTEEFQQTVPLTREEITVEREPVEDSGLGDTRMEAEDQEITLYEEHATVSKESVPVERVRVVKNEVTEQQTVRGERRTERVELEDDDFQEPPE